VHFQGNLKEMSKINAEKLKKSIVKHGWIAPVFTWNGNNIIDGHGRLLVLGEMLKNGHSIGEIPVVDIQAKDRKEAAEILLSINSHYQKITGDGLYEFMNDMELNLEGLTDFVLPDIDLDRFEAEFFEKKGNIEDDEIPEAKEAITKTGDLWLLGEHRLLCGDATKKEDVERLMDGKKADMVFTDPPYGVRNADKNKYLNAISPGNRIQTEIKQDHVSEKDIMAFWKISFERIRDTLADINSYYIFGPQIQGMMMMMMQEAGLPYRHVIIWVKNNHVLGRCDYNYRHEPIFFGWTSKHKFYGNGQWQTSVWDCPKPLKNDLHPTMKPVALIINALQNSSLKGQICLDPFLGSGSTLIACEKTNRICYGMEIDEHYCDVIVTRWEQFTGKKAALSN
jgi:DNA modification methylase